MRKMWLIVMLSVAITFLVSCKPNEEEEMTRVFYEEYTADDTSTLDEVLTEEYDLEELKAFFQCGKMNEYTIRSEELRWISFSEVNDKFPVEVIRTHGYSVYRVKQGGYFYVFWSEKSESSEPEGKIEPDVYFSTYLTNTLEKDAFDVLQPRVSTAENVKAIDPWFEYNDFLSSGIYSYSYLSEDKLMRITYSSKAKIEGYEDLVVEHMEVVNRKDNSSRFRSILAKDLPKE